MSQPNVVPLQTDIISRFMRMTDADDTPHLYRKWAAISLVAGALERRVWTPAGSRGGRVRKTYPNLFVFLVGAPGVGKAIVGDVRDLWRDVVEPGGKPALHVADNNMTKASMIDNLDDAVKSFLPPKGPPEEYHSMLIASEEFGVFLSNYDTHFVAVLNEIYNAPPSYSERRRHGPAKMVTVVNPIMNIIGGVQPIWMNTVFPPQAWGMGLCSRLIMVYATSGDPVDPFADGPVMEIERMRLVESLGKLSQLYGEVRWDAESHKMMLDWHMRGGPPVPTHSKLEHYCRRRTLHAIKLALISSVSRTRQVGLIELTDVERAISWLLEAEELMPDIFRSMIGQSDMEVIDEMYNYMVNLYGMSKGQPINENFLISFLLKRVPADKVNRILEGAERAKVIIRIGGSDTYKPGDKKEFAE